MSISFPPEIEANGRGDTYAHVSGHEATDPLVVDAALTTHAIGYVDDMGFVTPEAIDQNGHIIPDIDHARGPEVEYFVATDPSNPGENRATMRIISLASGQTVEDLPAYQVTQEALTAEGKALLQSIEAIHLKEIAALAKSNHAAAVGLFEIVRKTIHEAIGTGDVWFFSIVAGTHASLCGRMAARSFTVLGTDVEIDDDRVDAEQVKLRPVLFSPSDFIDNLADAIIEPNEEESSAEAQHKLQSGFKFFTAGLEADKMSEKAVRLREQLAKPIGESLLGQQ